MNVAAAGYFDPAELNRILPKLPQPVSTPRPTPITALSDDDTEVIATLSQKPTFRKLYAGDVSDYADEHGNVDDSAADWGMVRELLRATGLDAERTERLARQSALAVTRNGRWDETRTGKNLLRYSIDRAIERWDGDEVVNASEYRSPQHGLTGGGCSCRDCPYRRQVMLIGKLVTADLTPIFKVVLLRLAMLVGWHQSQGEVSFTGSAVKIAESIHGVSSQSVRAVLHAIVRRNRGELVREDGLLDLEVEHRRIVEKHRLLEDADTVLEFSEFRFTPATRGAYLGFFEALEGFVPELPPAPKRAPRQKKDEAVPIAPSVEIIAGCPEHATPTMTSCLVTCAECGDEIVKESRYYRVNDTHYRSPTRPSPWLSRGDTGYRSLPAPGEPNGHEIREDCRPGQVSVAGVVSCGGGLQP